MIGHSRRLAVLDLLHDLAEIRNALFVQLLRQANIPVIEADDMKSLCRDALTKGRRPVDKLEPQAGDQEDGRISGIAEGFILKGEAVTDHICHGRGSFSN